MIRFYVENGFYHGNAAHKVDLGLSPWDELNTSNVTELAIFHSLLVIFYSLLVAILLVTHCFFTRYSLLFYSLLVAFLLVTRCLFTRYSLLFLVTRYLLLFTRYLSLFTRYSLRFYSLLVAFLLVTRYFSRYSLRFYSLLVTFYSLLVAFLLVTRCLFTRYLLFCCFTCYSLFFTHYSLNYVSNVYALNLKILVSFRPLTVQTPKCFGRCVNLRFLSLNMKQFSS